jgi:hypothetical protein
MNMTAQQNTVPANIPGFSGNALTETAIVDFGPAPPNSYDCTLNLSVVGGGHLIIEFKRKKTVIAKLECHKVGEIGGYTGWGTAWLHAPIETLLDLDARVSIELIETRNCTAQVRISHAGTVIGGCTTCGIGIGCGSGTGQAAFKAYPA